MGRISNWFSGYDAGLPSPTPRNLLVITSGLGAYVYTTDGINYLNASVSPPFAAGSVAYAGNDFICTGINAGNIEVWRTSDGDVWALDSILVAAAFDNALIAGNIARVCACETFVGGAGNIFLGPSGGPYVSTNIDPTSVVPVLGLSGNPFVSSFAFVALGFDGVNINLYHSDDGITFNIVYAWPYSLVVGFFRAGNRFFFQDPSYLCTFNTSGFFPIGTAAQVTTGMDPTVLITSVAFDGTYYIAANENGEMARTLDPENGPYAPVTAPVALTSHKLAVVGTTLVAVALNGTNDVYFSTDHGDSWTLATSGTYFTPCGAN